MKYKFEKNLFVNIPMEFREILLEQLKKIGVKEGVFLKEVVDGLLSIAVKEYWEERKVKKIKKSGKAKGITASVRRSKQVLTKGTSYCQYSGCPYKGQNYLTKNMLKHEKMVFCSGECKEKFINELG